MKESRNFKLIGIAMLFIIGLTACNKEGSVMGSYANKTQAQNSPQPTAATSSVNETYEAIFTCGLNSSQNLNILACFSGGSNGADTELEIQNGEQYGMYKAYNLNSIGSEDQQGFHIRLKNHFSIKAQNSDETLILSLKIVDSTGKVVFQKSAAHYGVISVKN